MVTYYCPQCWTIIHEKDTTCPHCGYDLARFSQLSFEDKLITALGHPVQERQLIAAQMLGKLGSRRALPVFMEIIRRADTNYFLARAVLEAAARIPDPRRLEVLGLGKSHPSVMIRELAAELIQQVNDGQAGDSQDVSKVEP